MKKMIGLSLFLFALMIKGQSQETIFPTDSFATDFKKLVEINSHTPNLINMAGKEAVNICDNATPAQIMEITAPYLRSETINTKYVCLNVLNVALFKRTMSHEQRQQLTEILCKNYFDSWEDIQAVDNSLLYLHEEDFNARSKEYISALIQDGTTRHSTSLCAKLLAVAQVKSSIPVLWKLVNSDTATLQPSDLDILASLAHMGEKKAGLILCAYYNGKRNNKDYRHALLSRALAFSLDKNVLDCLIKDFKSIDLSISFRDYDTFFSPTYYLGGFIAGMLKEYPYARQEYSVDAKALSQWLNTRDNYVVADK